MEKVKKEKVKKKKTKTKKKAGRFDPFKLDGTRYARLVAMVTNADGADDAAQDKASAVELEMTDVHPLLQNQAVQRIIEEVRRFRHDLRAKRYPGGDCITDPYQEFMEGLVLRLEVTVKIIIDYLRAHPELLE